MMHASPDQHDARDGSAWANASMVLAIASLPTALIAGMGFIAGTAAIVMGILGRRSKKRHLATFGILVGSIGVAISVAAVILWFVLWHASQ